MPINNERGKPGQLSQIPFSYPQDQLFPISPENIRVQFKMAFLN
jgi:hypothetical protein